MAAPDPAYVRMYNNERERHRKAVLREVADIAERSRLLLERMNDASRPEPPSLIAGAARRLATDAATAWARAEAFAAVDEVSFLTTTTDAEA